MDFAGNEFDMLRLVLLHALAPLAATAALAASTGLAAGAPGVAPGSRRQGIGLRGVFLATAIVGPGRGYVGGLDDFLAFAFFLGGALGPGRLVQRPGFAFLGLGR